MSEIQQNEMGLPISLLTELLTFNPDLEIPLALNGKNFKIKGKTIQGIDHYISSGTMRCSQKSASAISKQTDFVVFIDQTGSFSPEDDEKIRSEMTQYWNTFISENPTYTGKLYIIEYETERWLREPVQLLIAAGLKDVFCMIFTNEAHEDYHGWSNNPVYYNQPTTQYINDYNYFFESISFFTNFKAVIIAVPSNFQTGWDQPMACFQLQAYAAIKGTVVSETDFIESNLAESIGETIGAIKTSNPYAALPKKLSDYGWNEIHHFTQNYLSQIPYAEFESIIDTQIQSSSGEKKIILELHYKDEALPPLTIEADVSECMAGAMVSMDQPVETVETFEKQSNIAAGTPIEFSLSNKIYCMVDGKEVRSVDVLHNNDKLQRSQYSYTHGSNIVTVTLPYQYVAGMKTDIEYWYMKGGYVPPETINVTVSNQGYTLNSATNDVTLTFKIKNNGSKAVTLNYAIELNGVTHQKTTQLLPYEEVTVTDVFMNVATGTHTANITGGITTTIPNIVVPEKTANLNYSASLTSNSFTHTAKVTVANSGTLAALDQVYFQWDAGAKLPSGQLNIADGSSVIFTNTKVENTAGAHTCKIYKSDQVTLIATLNYTVAAAPTNVHPTNVWWAEVIDRSGTLYPERYSLNLSGAIDIGRINVNTGSVSRIVAKFDTTYLKSIVSARLKWYDARGFQAMTIYLNKSTFDVNNPNCIAIWNTYTDNLGGVQSYVGSGINQIELNATALNIIKNGGLTEILILMRESNPSTSNTEVVLNNLYLELTY